MTKAKGLRAAAVALGLVLAGTAVPAEAKTFRLAINADASTLDPHAQNSQVNFAILLQAYEPLVGRDKDLKPVPVLATRWEAVEPMRWRFFLRPGVRFHDGAALTADDVVFLAGSTQAPEEELAIDAFQAFAAAHPRLRLVIVPRHVERADEIAALLDRAGLRWRRRSRLDPAGADPAARVLLVDTTGELGWWWGTAAIAFVGGSLDGRRGGQNMLEPAAYGAAVCFGPHTRNFAREVETLLAADAACVVADGGALRAFVGRCLADAAWARMLGDRAAATVHACRGATALTAREVLARLRHRP